MINQLGKFKLEGVVYKHFQTGCCKFQEPYRKPHIKEIC